MPDPKDRPWLLEFDKIAAYLYHDSHRKDDYKYLQELYDLRHEMEQASYDYEDEFLDWYFGKGGLAELNDNISLAEQTFEKGKARLNLLLQYAKNGIT